MDSTAAILAEQVSWAIGAGLCPDPAGYLPHWQSNLARPLSLAAKSAFDAGAGSELLSSTDGPPKMAALHSSAALAVNIFDYWTNRSLEPVAEALDLGETPAAIAFEARFSTGLRGTPPTLDVAFRCPNGKVIGIESKFTEWLAPKAHGGNNFTASYFPKNRGLWTLAGLDGAQSLASALRVGHEQFRHLDAAQLLKHMLGLATQHREAAALYYIFYDWPAGPESALHREEIRRFSLHIGNELSFRWATYQDVFSCLAPAVRSTQSQYVQYVQQRYFRDAV